MQLPLYVPPDAAAIQKMSFANAGAGHDNICDEPSTAPQEPAPQEQPASDFSVLWDNTLMPLKAKMARLHAHKDELQAQLVVAKADASIAQQERDIPGRTAGADSPGAAASLLAQVEQAEAFWKLKQQEAAEAEAEWKALRLQADSVSKVERLQVAMNKVDRELAACREDVLKYF